MKKRCLFICGLFLLSSPILSTENFIDRAIKFTSGKIRCWVSQENEKKIGEELEYLPAAEEKTIQQLVSESEAWDTKTKRELMYPADLFWNKNKQSQNNKLKAHFIGDGYGWIIVYY